MQRVACDSHAGNVSVFKKLLNSFAGEDSDSLSIKAVSKKDLFMF